MKYDFALGFVTYHPSPAFLDRLELLNRLGCKVYLYDNSPEQSLIRPQIKALESITYITAGKNLGLGVGLSTVCAQAYYESFPALLFFDQDTIFNQETITFVQEYCSGNLKQIQNEYSLIVFGESDYRIDDPNSLAIPSKFDLVDISLAISSGSLFILENLKKIGWHNEKYFVDGVDYEICLKSLANNLKVGKCFNTPGFDHSSEQPDKTYKIFGVSLSLRCYSLFRIIDTAKSNTRLLFSALRMGQFKFALSIVRSYAIYVAAQILARIVPK
jgi:rhamnosyltransferase